MRIRNRIRARRLAPARFLKYLPRSIRRRIRRQRRRAEASWLPRFSTAPKPIGTAWL